MKANYPPCETRVLAHEGGYTNDPRDPGGPTNFGITIYDYRKYAKPGATAADVQRMSLAEAQRIYKAKYWDALRCDELPAGVDDTVFDYGVNSGIGRAGKVLRRVLGLSDADWRVTDAVLAALKLRDPAKVVVAINDERLAFLKSLRTWRAFGVGWSRRVAEVKAFSLELARAAVVAPGGVVPVAQAPKVAPAPGKGHVAAPVAEAPHAAGPATVVAGGAAGAHVAGLPLWAVLTLLGFAAAIALLGYLAWRKLAARQAAQEAPTAGLVPVPPLSPAAIAAVRPA